MEGAIRNFLAEEEDFKNPNKTKIDYDTSAHIFPLRRYSPTYSSFCKKFCPSEELKYQSLVIFLVIRSFSLYVRRI